MFEYQTEPTKFENKTEPELIRSGTPDIGEVTCHDQPKVEIEGKGKIAAQFSYGETEVTGSLEASGKGKMGLRICGREKRTPQWWQDVTYQREIKVMAQRLGLEYGLFTLEGSFDWLEPDQISAWREVSRSAEYRKDKMEFEVTSIQLYDPPLIPDVSSLPLRLSEGKFVPKVANFDGTQIAIAVGSSQSAVTISTHSLLLDGRLITDADQLFFGSGALAVGLHSITVIAQFAGGDLKFELPVEVVPPLQLSVVDPFRLCLFDERKTFKVSIKNNTTRVQHLRLTCTANANGWLLIPPINPVTVEPARAIEVEIEAHIYPTNDPSMQGRIAVAAIGEDGVRAHASFDVAALFPISAVRSLEQEAVRALNVGRNAQKNYFFL
jgi:hypothetical protein